MSVKNLGDQASIDSAQNVQVDQASLDGVEQEFGDNVLEELGGLFDGDRDVDDVSDYEESWPVKSIAEICALTRADLILEADHYNLCYASKANKTVLKKFKFRFNTF